MFAGDCSLDPFRPHLVRTTLYHFENSLSRLFLSCFAAEKVMQYNDAWQLIIHVKIAPNRSEASKLVRINTYSTQNLTLKIQCYQLKTTGLSTILSIKQIEACWKWEPRTLCLNLSNHVLLYCKTIVFVGNQLLN